MRIHTIVPSLYRSLPGAFAITGSIWPIWQLAILVIYQTGIGDLPNEPLTSTY
jgi:hypothetical protein